MFNYFTKIFFIFLLLISVSSCDAPRDNVLDPQNPDNTIHNLTGTVKTTSVPFHPIQDVYVTVKNKDIVTQTNASGNFSITLYDNSDFTLYFSKPEYHYDSLTLSWTGGKQKNIDKHLNAKPQLDDVSFFSIVEFKYPDNKITTLTVNAKISDSELDDIHSIFIENEFFNLSKPLTYNVAKTCYELTLTVNDFSLFNVEEVIGKDFNILVQNSTENKFVVGTTNIKRIINLQPEFISPANNIDTITTGPTLKWRRFTAGYDFTYTAQVYTNEIWPRLIWEKENIPSSEIEIFVDKNLWPDEYFWVIWCVDEFNNMARSKPASFKVIN